MKFSTGALLCLMASGVSAKKTKKSKKEDEVVCPETDLTEKPTKLDLCPFYDYKHYLVRTVCRLLSWTGACRMRCAWGEKRTGGLTLKVDTDFAAAANRSAS